MVKAKQHIWHSMEVGKAAKVLKTDLAKGLSEKEVKIRQNKAKLQ